MRIQELIQKFQDWAKGKIVKLRVENKEQGYTFHAKAIGFDKELTLGEFQNFFTRKKLNDEYMKRFKNTDIPSKQACAWYQTEINMFYSYHKCFAMRHRGRLEYYRSDLSQKGARAYSTINIGMARFLHLRDIAEK